jgi:hypothetical protein
VDDKELAFEIRQLDRVLVEILVASKLNELAKEAATKAVDCMGTGKYTAPDTRKWARKIISIVKEHSV